MSRYHLDRQNSKFNKNLQKNSERIRITLKIKKKIEAENVTECGPVEHEAYIHISFRGAGRIFDQNVRPKRLMSDDM